MRTRAADGPGDFDGHGEYVLVDAAPVEMDTNGVENTPQVQFTLFAVARAGVYGFDVD
ncbi:DUF6225 family protein [Streptomyces sp. NPDC029216]|uniref:DUF6225 family protein n=1 Tax=Streptomyces sp. NPDC029216 TaxID=3154701 RepID=UPI0034099263